jgi:hypothetical protein
MNNKRGIDICQNIVPQPSLRNTSNDKKNEGIISSATNGDRLTIVTSQGMSNTRETDPKKSNQKKKELK